MEKINQSNRIHPGPQTKMWSMNFTMGILIFLISLLFVLIVYSVLQDNSDLFPNIKPYLTIKLIDTKTSFSIFVSLIGLALVRYHFLVGTLPRLNYEGDHILNPTLDEALFTGNTWQVKLKNVGLGAAIVKKYLFRVGFEQIENSSYDKSYYELIEILSKQGIKNATDFCLNNYTGDYTFPAKDEQIIFEISVPATAKVKQIDLYIEFRGILGTRFKKEIYLVPRQGVRKSVELFSTK